MQVTGGKDIRYVSYVKFIEDYEDIETLGICAGKNELSLSNKIQTREIELRQKAALTKKLSELPVASQEIYSKMSKYIQKKVLEEKFIMSLVNAD